MGEPEPTEPPKAMRLAEVVGRLLPALEDAFPVNVLGAVRRVLGEAVGAGEVMLLLSDYDQDVLRELTDGVTGVGRTLDVDGSDAGRAFRLQEGVVVRDGDDTVVHVPMSTQGERLGVLTVRAPRTEVAHEVGALRDVATVLAHVVPRISWYSDQVELTRRVVPLTLPAEMQWSELPVRAYGCDRFDIAGDLCPAYEVGGDLFDYTVDGDLLQVTALDAMGHGLQASLLGTLAIHALRNNRRAGLTLADQVRGADRVLYGEHGGEKFVCAAILRLDTRTGELEVVNAGHPVGALVRGGTATMLEVPAQLPMGMFERTIYELHPLRLEPGDRLVLVSDGVVEAAPPGGEEYGEDRFCAELAHLSDLSASETVRRLVRTLRTYEGVELRDDITVVVLDWRGVSR